MISQRRMLDLTLTTGIVGILIALVLARQDTLSDQMEESAVQAEAAALRVELLDMASHQQIWGGVPPRDKNPVTWAGRTPVGYVGELASPPEQGGIWYYDTEQEELVYRFRHGQEARFRLAARADEQRARGAIGAVGLLRVK